MTVLAVERLSSWEFPLFVHVAGALLYTAALVVSAVFLAAAWRPRADGGDVVTLSRLGFRWLLLGVLPSFIVMRGAAEWVLSKEPDAVEDLDWVGIGYAITDLGLLLLIAACVTAGLASRRAAERGPTGVSRAAGIITMILVALAFVGIWAMTAKPG